jgi:hypothetical protein
VSKDIIEIINDNVTFLQYYEKQRKEIERLKELDQEHQKLNGELREEIERLNKENEELKKIQCTFLGTGCEAEIERLNNIINKFENSLTESNKYINNPAFRELFREQLEYLQELKGEDKE